jgi:hypothetical protein
MWNKSNDCDSAKYFSSISRSNTLLDVFVTAGLGVIPEPSSHPAEREAASAKEMATYLRGH